MEITNNQIPTLTLQDAKSPRVNVVDLANKVTSEVLANNSESTATSENEKQGSEQETSNQAGNLQAAVSQINDHVQNLQRDLVFTVDDVTGKEVVTVIDRQSEEIIRQIPSEEALVLARRLAENKEDGVQLFSTLV
jgi:flagellar protein FlaG